MFLACLLFILLLALLSLFCFDFCHIYSVFFLFFLFYSYPVTVMCLLWANIAQNFAVQNVFWRSNKKKEVYKYIIVSAPAFISHSTQQGFSSTAERWSVSPMNVKQIKPSRCLDMSRKQRNPVEIFTYFNLSQC